MVRQAARRFCAVLAVGAALPLAPAGADPAPAPYCAFDPTGNAGSWSDPCEPAGLGPDGRYRPPALPWAPATDPDTGLTRNPYAAGG